MAGRAFPAPTEFVRTGYGGPGVILPTHPSSVWWIPRPKHLEGRRAHSKKGWPLLFRSRPRCRDTLARTASFLDLHKGSGASGYSPTKALRTRSLTSEGKSAFASH